VLAIALLAAACSSQAATEPPVSVAPGPSATALASSTPSQVASPSAIPSVAPSAVPASAGPSHSPAAAAPLVVDWKPQDVSGIGKVEAVVGVAKVGGTYVLLADMPYTDGTTPGAAIWWSSDGAAWTDVMDFPSEDNVNALTAGGPGFVVAGTNNTNGAVWTSTDGRVWKAATDPSLNDAGIYQLVATSSGLVGFGSRTDNGAAGLWTSPDGLEWLAATNETGMTVAKGLEAVSSHAGRAIAFVSEGDQKPPAIWETTGRAEWTRTGTLPEAASIARVAGGDRGWLAVGDNRAWTSTDGITWTKGVAGPDVNADAIVDDAGFVVVGFVGSLPGETCGDQRPFESHTWTSSDGRIWERMPVTNAFKQATLTTLLRVDRTLLGYGQSVAGDYNGTGFPVAGWKDALPDLSKPGDATDKATVPKTCGG